jgi:hypothetical protein
MMYDKEHVKHASGPQPKKKLLDRARDIMRVRHYSIRTERSYINWIRRYILFHGKRHPREMGPDEIEAFLTHLARFGFTAVVMVSPFSSSPRPPMADELGDKASDGPDDPAAHGTPGVPSSVPGHLRVVCPPGARYPGAASVPRSRHPSASGGT